MKILFASIILFMLCKAVDAQDAPKVFFHKDSLTLSKDYILKLGELQISDTSYVIDSFVYIITGMRINGDDVPAFGVNKSNKFCQHFIDEVKNKKDKSGSIIIQDIYVHHPTKDFGYTRKLAQVSAVKF